MASSISLDLPESEVVIDPFDGQPRVPSIQSKPSELKRKKLDSSEGSSSCDEEPIAIKTGPFRHFVVMEPVDASKPLTALNPFLVNKFFQANVGAVKVTPMRSGSLLIETDRRTYVPLLLGIKEMANTPVKVAPHRSLNSSREGDTMPRASQGSCRRY